MKNLTVETRKIGNVTVLDLHGKLEDCASNDILQEAITCLIENGQNQLLLNLAKVSGLDLSCLSQLISSHITLSRRGVHIKLLHLPRVSLLTTNIIKRLQDILDIYESESEAIDSFKIPAFDLVKKNHGLFPDTCYKTLPVDWSTRGMSITFCPELMPNYSRLKRTFTIKELLPSGRVTLKGIDGKYVKESFENVKYSIR
jgi:anti-anti-sigma factor